MLILKIGVAPTSGSSPEIIYVTYVGTNIGLFVNVLAKTPSKTTGTITEANYTCSFGDYGIDQPWLGKISEIIVFNRKLNTTEQRSVEDYFKQKI